MNDIYQDNHAGLRFGFPFVDPSLHIPGLGSQVPGVRVSDQSITPDFTTVSSQFNSTRLFNVFFVGRFIDLDDPTNPRPSIHAQTTGPPIGPKSPKPLRCCLCRDALNGDPPDFDWGETLAHEAGHALGERDDLNDPHLLMFKFGDRRIGTRIDSETARRMIAGGLRLTGACKQTTRGSTARTRASRNRVPFRTHRTRWLQ
jgi:hypothetical protein